MSNLVLLSLITFLAYGILAIFFWRAQLAGNGESLSKGLVGQLVLAPLAIHGYLLNEHMFTSSGINLGLVYVISLILWLTLLVYWVARFFYPISSLQTLVLPLAAVGVLLPAMFPREHPISSGVSFALDAHIVAAILVYSLFTIAALHASLMSLVEKRLHHATVPLVLRTLPPLLTMENLLFRIIATGFIVLTLTLASGIVFSEEVFGKPWEFNHKMLFGFISWGVFAVLLTGHHYYGWRGRKAVHWTMSGYIFLILAYLGTKFVMEVLLHRS